MEEKERIQDLKIRFTAFTDMGALSGASGIGNPAAYFRDEILANPVPDDAEKKMTNLELIYEKAIPVFDYNDKKQRADRVCKEIEHILDKTDWKDFTPTGSWVTNTTYTGKYRRVGDSLEAMIKVEVVGAPTATALTIDVPSSLTVDTSKLQLIAAEAVIGQGHVLDNGITRYNLQNYYTSSSGKILVRTIETGSARSSAADVTATDPMTFASGDGLELTIKLPIAGWSSNARISEDLGGRDVFVEGRGNGNTIIGAYSTNIDFTEIEDTTSSWNGTQFTAPESGKYSIEGLVLLSAAQIDLIILSYIDGVADKALNKGSASNNNRISFSGTISLQKGEVLSIRSSKAVTLSSSVQDHHIAITKLASPQTLLETETVAARYTSDSGQSVPNNSVVSSIFEDIDYDTHNAYNTSTGEYTIPISGKYVVETSNGFPITGSGRCLTQILVNSTAIATTDVAFGTSSPVVPRTVVILDLSKGDIVTTAAYQNSGSASSIISDSPRNTFSIARIK